MLVTYIVTRWIIRRRLELVNLSAQVNLAEGRHEPLPLPNWMDAQLDVFDGAMTGPWTDTCDGTVAGNARTETATGRSGRSLQEALKIPIQDEPRGGGHPNHRGQQVTTGGGTCCAIGPRRRHGCIRRRWLHRCKTGQRTTREIRFSFPRFSFSLSCMCSFSWD